MNPWIILIAFALGATGSWQVQEWRRGAIDNQRHQVEAREQLRQIEHVDKTAETLEQDKTRIEIRYRTITKEVDHVTQGDFYAAGQPACLDDPGLRELTRAIHPAAAASEPAPAVSGPRRAVGR